MSAFSNSVRDRVTHRAGHRCEYCRLPCRGQVATFPIDHIRPRVDGGSNDDTNLALACPHCNAHKWTATVGPDPESGAIARYFSPRQEAWDDHFDWSRVVSGELLGRTPTGRATVAGLRINDPDMIALRELLGALGLFPDVTG